MQLRAGYELIYSFPRPTPIILVVNIHYSRASDIVIPDRLITEPFFPITPYRDGFGNFCLRGLAPAGRVRLTADCVIMDNGQPDEIVSDAGQDSVQDLPEEALSFLLGSRYLRNRFAIKDNLAALQRHDSGVSARAGNLRLRSSPHCLRLSEGSRHS